jgi:superfamily II DNA or RNA helicase
MQNYHNFLEHKKFIMPAAGIKVNPDEVNSQLFEFERDIVLWALQKGKSAIFAGTGLGKTLMQSEWANILVKHGIDKIIILAPLAVSQQTVREAEKFSIKITLCREPEDVQPGINITNYERMDKFDMSQFGGVVLDESSIIKGVTSKTKESIIETFKYTPYKLACTATPAPNDHVELGNHSEFLGVMSSVEMLSMFFVHDGGDTSKWRLKGHAVKDYWQWVASWAVMLTKPSDLGYEDDRYNLPPLRIHQITVKVAAPTESLFAVEAQTLQERQAARRDSIDDRVKACADIVNMSDEPWLIWCNLNSEQDALKKLFGKNCVSIQGSTPPDEKIKLEELWRKGEVPILVSKPVVFGYGMNWQHCSKMAFVGLSDSFEQFYQAVRRSWRFGQVNPVDVYVFTAETEGAVVANIERKERDFEVMLSGMIAATQEITRKNIRGTEKETIEYNPKERMILPSWI